MFERVEGKAQELAGHAQEAIGKVTGDDTMRVEGRARQLAGKAQDTYGAAMDQVREAAITNPLGALVTVGAAGFVLGALWARR